MAGQCCDNCVYSVCDPELWRRWLWLGEPILPRCANYPQWPGRLHDVPGVACHNYRPKPVLPEGDGVRLIPLGDGFYAYVDAPDYEELSRYTWHFNNGYAARKDKARRIYMHREIMQAPQGRVVDHFDANRTNNCWLNLRICTPAENQHNQRKQNGASSRFKGVFYSKQRHKWCAKCWFGGRHHLLGFFDDEVEAARAYDRKAVELFGEFARLNFPEEWPPHRRQEVYAHRDAAKGEGKKVRRKEAKTTPAKPRATSKGKNKKPHVETLGRRDRRRTTKRQPQRARKTAGHKGEKRSMSRRPR
jgi:hypothetical protein